eukprot:2577427-Rhodomonas_salina.1
MVHEQLNKGVLEARHRVRGRLTMIKYQNPLSGKEIEIKNIYMPAGATAPERGVRERMMTQ